MSSSEEQSIDITCEKCNLVLKLKRDEIACTYKTIKCPRCAAEQHRISHCTFCKSKNCKS
ncbi:MAG TPA: hypothetical protein DCS13_12545 [Candidatus Margulisbacteria bacterium]|nr:MAG: hypothetical protein A2X43_06695 [Candidatus Margulisbacteria bacterium GWD2_39_127]HAR64287.1 hypothetical protein [Candidatus Margulisiibacteriota bacterium]